MQRRTFLTRAILGLIAASPLARAAGKMADSSVHGRMPVVFVGHGSPMNALQDNEFTRHLVKLGQDLPRPRAILVISAHWQADRILLSSSARPETIYDFGGFPRALYEIRYPCPGEPRLAQQWANHLPAGAAGLDPQRGLDHGAWTILHHLYPKADIPVVQLSLSRRLDMRGHLSLATELQALRDQQILILASGNIVHNLYLIDRTMGSQPHGWAREFDELVKRALLQRDLTQLLAEDSRQHPLWQLAHPSLEHYLPLLYALGASSAKDKISFPYEGFQEGSLAMRSVRFG